MNTDPISTELARLCRGHRPSDEVECARQRTILDWLAGAHDPLNREAFKPGHATGSGFVVSEKKRAALIFHKLGRWVQPGGHADRGETDVRAVAARETSEELGIDLDPAELTLFDLDVYDIPARGDTPRHIDFDFRFAVSVPEVDLRPASDAEQARWFTARELAALPLDPGLRRMVGKAVRQGVLL